MVDVVGGARVLSPMRTSGGDDGHVDGFTVSFRSLVGARFTADPDGPVLLGEKLPEVAELSRLADERGASDANMRFTGVFEYSDDGALLASQGGGADARGSGEFVLVALFEQLDGPGGLVYRLSVEDTTEAGPNVDVVFETFLEAVLPCFGDRYDDLVDGWILSGLRYWNSIRSKQQEQQPPQRLAPPLVGLESVDAMVSPPQSDDAADPIGTLGYQLTSKLVRPFPRVEIPTELRSLAGTAEATMLYDSSDTIDSVSALKEISSGIEREGSRFGFAAGVACVEFEHLTVGKHIKKIRTEAGIRITSTARERQKEARFLIRTVLHFADGQELENTYGPFQIVTELKAIPADVRNQRAKLVGKYDTAKSPSLKVLDDTDVDSEPWQPLRFQLLSELTKMLSSFAPQASSEQIRELARDYELGQFSVFSGRPDGFREYRRTMERKIQQARDAPPHRQRRYAPSQFEQQQRRSQQRDDRIPAENTPDETSTVEAQSSLLGPARASSSKKRARDNLTSSISLPWSLTCASDSNSTNPRRPLKKNKKTHVGDLRAWLDEYVKPTSMATEIAGALSIAGVENVEDLEDIESWELPRIGVTLSRIASYKLFQALSENAPSASS
jgi:hypothetical protein